MSHIWVTGDIHGDPRRLNRNSFFEQKLMKDQDDNFVIICGDFGLVWDYRGENSGERYYLNWLESKKFTTLFVDGNHENHKRLAEYPVTEWHGGKVHKIRPHVIHLMRGEVYTIGGKTFFTFGGAASHDISDGILDPVEDADKIKRWSKDYSKLFRIDGVSWWKEEMPDREERQHGWDTLQKHDYKVDYIITHSPPASVLSLLNYEGLYEQDELTGYLEEIRHKVDYKHWFFGHLHNDRAVTAKDALLYYQIVKIHSSSSNQ